MGHANTSRVALQIKYVEAEWVKDKDFTTSTSTLVIWFEKQIGEKSSIIQFDQNSVCKKILNVNYWNCTKIRMKLDVTWTKEHEKAS